jgi:hypothetical protein
VLGLIAVAFLASRIRRFLRRRRERKRLRQAGRVHLSERSGA